MFEIAFLFWYCYDDRLAQALNMPALGNVPYDVWGTIFGIWFASIFISALIKTIREL